MAFTPIIIVKFTTILLLSLEYVIVVHYLALFFSGNLYWALSFPVSSLIVACMDSMLCWCFVTIYLHCSLSHIWFARMHLVFMSVFAHDFAWFCFFRQSNLKYRLSSILSFPLLQCLGIVYSAACINHAFICSPSSSKFGMSFSALNLFWTATLNLTLIAESDLSTLMSSLIFLVVHFLFFRLSQDVTCTDTWTELQSLLFVGISKSIIDRLIIDFICDLLEVAKSSVFLGDIEA